VINSRRWAGYMARTGQRRVAYWVSAGRPERKRPLGRQRRRWEGNIKMDLQEVGWRGMDWIDVGQDRQVAGAFECGNETSGSIKCGEILD
jgi:hypothetical protein